ncbi:MAG: hypothetical protein HC820_10410 [Hydrococcus sp. RM1_1_31]|nr:hypothetical protein [Hydrococcus sp. RM1_1_31]
MTQEEIFNKLEEIVALINLPTKSYEITSDLFVLLKVKNKLREAMRLLSFSPETAINSMLEKKEQKDD